MTAVRYLHVFLDLLQLISQFSERVDDQTCIHTRGDNTSVYCRR